MVKGMCRRPDCNFTFDDAEHIEDAVAKLAAHFRNEHDRKAFYADSYREYLETYNCTLDEAIENYLGRGYQQLPENQLPRQIVNACSQIVRYRTYSPEVVEEAIARAREYGTELAPPEPEQPLANLHFDPMVQFIEEAMDEMPPEEPF